MQKAYLKIGGGCVAVMFGFSLVCILHQSRDSDEVVLHHEKSTTDPHDTRIGTCNQEYWCGWYYVV